MKKPTNACPDCESKDVGKMEDLSRRAVLKGAAGVVAAGAAAASGIWSLTVTSRATAGGVAVDGAGKGLAAAAESGAKAASAPETLVAQLFKSLNDEQKKGICFPFDHSLRSDVDNNWFITDKKIGKNFNPDQQALVRDIFMGIHSEEYAQKVMAQVEHDNKDDGGFKSCAVALFGEPGNGKFEFVLTGRHVTRRCDGNSVDGAAFGGPIFYGHAAESFNEKPDHPGNAYWFQAQRANEVFKALDEKQRKLALRQDPREEKGSKTVALKDEKSIGGVPMTELAKDQQALVRKVMADLLAPFRKADADEAMKLIEAGGFEKLRMAFYNNKGSDIGDDGVWDVWQIESPNMLWYFRGAPHVHTWVHIREPQKA